MSDYRTLSKLWNLWNYWEAKNKLEEYIGLSEYEVYKIMREKGLHHRTAERYAKHIIKILDNLELFRELWFLQPSYTCKTCRMALRELGIELPKQKTYRENNVQNDLLIEALIDNVFNTKEKLDEILSFNEIKERIENVLGYSVDKRTLQKTINFLVEIGVYEEVGVGKYKAGLPKAMDGAVDDTFLRLQQENEKRLKMAFEEFKKNRKRNRLRRITIIDYKIQPVLWRFWSCLEWENKIEYLVQLPLDKIAEIIKERNPSIKSEELPYIARYVKSVFEAASINPQTFRIIYLERFDKAAKKLQLHPHLCLLYNLYLRLFGIDANDRWPLQGIRGAKEKSELDPDLIKIRANYF